MTIISIQNVAYGYTQNLDALRGVSLDIQKGEFIAIVGHNGSGKSTLAKHLNGLFIPNSGKVYVHGMDTSDEELSLDIKKHVGIVFQNPDNQLVTTIVEDDVAFAPENMGIESNEIRKRVDAALENVGMSKYAQAAPHMLSGGQKQRIAIAGMLAMNPDVLVLDEATAMLDPAGRKSIISIAHKLNREQGMTVVMITQHMDEVVGADRVVVMKNGLIEFVDTPDRVFAQSARLKGAGLDVPPAVALRNELIANNVIKPTNSLTIEDIAEDIYRELRGTV